MQQPSLDPTQGQPMHVGPIMETAPPPEIPLTLSIVPPKSEQDDIVRQCNIFKQNALNHAKRKKLIMQRCYAYSKSQFFGDDLLPRPAANGQENDNSAQASNRPEIFMPVTREQLKILYSYLKLTIFPNDEEFFRIRSKTAEGAALEDQLTQAFKYLFKKNGLTEKLGEYLRNICWAGTTVGYPTFSQDMEWGWEMDLENGQWIPTISPGEKTLDFEVWNPIHFYLDPGCKDPEKSKWGYFRQKKINELKDSPFYFNKEQIDKWRISTPSDTQDREALSLTSYNGINRTFVDDEGNCNFDQYYFPYLKTNEREYRNMYVSVVGENALVEFRPNLLKGNPVVCCTWTSDTDSPYGTGPAEDMMDIQRLINILQNYKVESMARIGNRFIVAEDVDLTNFFGIAGGVGIARDPQSAVVPIHGDFVEFNHLDNSIGVLKAEAQLVAGAQNPFQGSANIDTKKTATEINLLQENSISILREVVEKLSLGGIQKIIERLCWIAAEIHEDEIEVPVSKPLGQTDYQMVDLSIFKSGMFTVELISVNPGQSKQAQAELLTQLVELLASNPQGVINAKPILVKIGELNGVKDIEYMIDECLQAMGMMQNVAAAAGYEQGGVMPGAGQPPSMGALPQTVPPEAVGAAPPSPGFPG